MFRSKNKKILEQGRARAVRRESRSTSSTFSYYANRPPDVAIPRVSNDRRAGREAVVRVKRRPTIPLAQIPFWLLLALVVVCAGKLLFLSTNPKLIVLGKSSVTNTYAQSSATYVAAAHKLLASSITNRTKLTANVTGTARALEKQYPELQTVSVALPLTGNRPIVYVQVAQPSVVLQTGGANYALSGSGTILAKLHSLPAGVPTLTDQATTTAIAGKQIVPGSTVSFIQTISQQFAAAKVAVSTYVLPSSAPFELDVHLEGQQYIVKYNLQADARQQSGAALATITQLGSSAPASYIDVRVPERIYYK